jgi:hypothetical protein
MSAHVMRLEWEGSFPSHTVVCNEPPEALCRAEFDCTCEEYAATGMGADGFPWHALTDGYMDDDDREQYELNGTRPRHYGRPGGECTYALWINNGDCAGELGSGTVDVPVTFMWDGDGYEWTVGSVS